MKEHYDEEAREYFERYWSFDELIDKVMEQIDEIERLNNIISNLEIYVRKRIELCYELGCTQEQFDIWNSIEMRIKELKGSDKK